MRSLAKLFGAHNNNNKAKDKTIINLYFKLGSQSSAGFSPGKDPHMNT